MDSKNYLKPKALNSLTKKYTQSLQYLLLTLATLAPLLLTNCTSSKSTDDKKEEYKIGEKVDTSTKLVKSDGSDQNLLAIFDKTIKKIHLFDIENMTHIKKFNVLHPEEKHYVYLSEGGSYIIDMSASSFAIHRPNGESILNPINMKGLPRSIAFNEHHNFFILQDQNRVVTILKISPQGFIQSQWQGGGQISSTLSFTSGDLLPDGTLAIGLSDRSLAFIDLNLTLANQSWTMKTGEAPIADASPEEIVWVGPCRSNSDYILLRSKNQVSLLSRSQKQIVDFIKIENYVAEKYSKNLDPHIVLRKLSNHSNSLTLVYANGSNKIVTHELYDHPEIVINSQLTLANQSWSFTDLLDHSDLHNSKKLIDIEDFDKGRHYRRFRITADFMLDQSFNIPDSPQILMANNFIFALFPSEMGYAVRYSVYQDTPEKELKLFNLKDLGKLK